MKVTTNKHSLYIKFIQSFRNRKEFYVDSIYIDLIL